ncbi:disease resistance RPP13 4 [Olea europaea subsp. europaea]|uniref:Disease resistance RPP13 4 n=1 Tax=Olea europaea subsp. europaea TaxID=158383 RepID=A0A8S0PJI1_OLEEU|nr:disease resistance RPP13 4 [Olea europaea subsp. europaea]
MASQRRKICVTQILSNCIDDWLKRHNSNGDVNNEVASTQAEIQKDLDETKEVFTQLKVLEDAIMATFQSLEEHISSDQTNEVSEKLKVIIKTRKEINKIITENFPEIEKKTFVRQQQSFPNDESKKKMPENSSRSQIEQNPSLSRTISQLQPDYDSLPENKKNCLLTLAAFPENAVIKKRILIHWWIGEGFVIKFGDLSIENVIMGSGQMTAEEVGEKIFGELIDEGWIQSRRKTKKSPTIYGCTMSPGIRRMLISNAQKSNFFDLDSNGNITKDDVQSGRLILDKGWLSNIDNHPQRRLLTIFNLNEKYLSPKEDLFSKNKNLKVLQLGRWQVSPRYHIEVDNCKFLDKLKTQKQLTYLSLRGISLITALPDSMGECVNLEILDLKACHNLERLFDMTNLTKLTHINVSECYCLPDTKEIFPHRLHYSVHVLKGVYGDDVLRLIYLPLTIPTFLPVRLRVITLTWRHDSSVELFKNDDFLTLLFLEKVQLSRYPLPDLPRFTFPHRLPNMKKLYIKGGFIENLSPMDPIDCGPWNVEILRLNYLKKFRLDDSYDIKHQFPNLLYLEKLNRHSSSTKKTHDKADIEWRKDEGWQTLNDKLKQ